MRPAHAADGFQRGAAFRQPLVLAPGRAVERVAVVGKHDRLDAEIAEDALEIAQIGRRDDAGQEVDDVLPRSALGKRSDDRPDGGLKTFGVRAGVAGRADMHDFRPGACGRLANFTQVIGDVLADRFRQTGRGDADDFGAVLPDDVFQSLAEVFAAAKDRRGLGKVRAGDVDRLFEVADHVAANVRRAALRPVQERDRAFDPAEGQARSQRRTHLAGVAGSRFRNRRLARRRDFTLNWSNHHSVLSQPRAITEETTKCTKHTKRESGPSFPMGCNSVLDFKLIFFSRVFRDLRGFPPIFGLTALSRHEFPNRGHH